MAPGDPGGPGLPAGPTGPGRLQTSCEEWMVMLRPFLAAAYVDWQHAADSRQNVTHIWSMTIAVGVTRIIFLFFSLVTSHSVNDQRWGENMEGFKDSEADSGGRSYNEGSVADFMLWHKRSCACFVSGHRLPYTACFCNSLTSQTTHQLVQDDPRAFSTSFHVLFRHGSKKRKTLPTWFPNNRLNTSLQNGAVEKCATLTRGP